MKIQRTWSSGEIAGSAWTLVGLVGVNVLAGERFQLAHDVIDVVRVGLGVFRQLEPQLNISPGNSDPNRQRSREAWIA